MSPSLGSSPPKDKKDPVSPKSKCANSKTFVGDIKTRQKSDKMRYSDYDKTVSKTP